MTFQTILTTEFASPERASLEKLRLQAGYFSDPSFLMNVVDAVPVLVLILNSERQTVYANERVMRAFDLNGLEDALGHRPGELLKCVHASERPEGCGTTRFCSTCGALRAIQSTLLGKQVVEECQILRHSHNQVEALDMRVWTRPLMVLGECFVILFLADIGHEKRRKALETIFFHDVLNTVGSVQLAVELLRRRIPGESQDDVDLTLLAVEQLTQEISAQKDLLSAENEELAVHTTTCHSLAVLEQVIEVCANHPVAEKRSLYIDPHSADVTFNSDPILLGRVIYNMLKNALEACEPGQTVAAGCRTNGNEISFWVHNPVYMPEKVQIQVFHRSFSTKGAGRGLGTYSMKLLSENFLNGKVAFISSHEQGTTFTATYPLT